MRLSKLCGRQSLKKLLSPLLNTLPHIEPCRCHSCHHPHCLQNEGFEECLETLVMSSHF